MSENAVGNIIVDSAVYLHRRNVDCLSSDKVAVAIEFEEEKFGEALMKNGITRTINGQIESDLRDSVPL